MSQAEVYDVLREELARIAPEIEFDDLDPNIDLREQVDLDSMDFLNLITALHQRLGVEISDADAAELATLEGAAAYVEKNRAAKA